MKNYKKLLIALCITFFGSWFNLIAIVSVIYTSTGSKLALGMAFAVKFLPKVLFCFGSTFIIDRFDKKKIMIISEITSCFAVLGLVIVTKCDGLILWIYVFYFIMNASTAIFDPVRIAIIPTLFEDKKDYSKAVTELTIVRYASMLIATGIGGLLLEIVGAKALLVFDAITFLISAVIISTMKIEYNKTPKTLKTSFTSSICGMAIDIKTGLGEVKKKTKIKSAILIIGCRQFAYGIAQVVFSLLILDKLAMSSSWLGISYAVGGVGCILAGFLFKRIQKNFSNESLYILFNLLIYPLNALAIFLMFVSGNIVLFLLSVFIHDIVSTSSEIFLETSIVTYAEKETIGKITAFYMTVGSLFYLLATVVYSVLLSGIGYVELGVILSLIMFVGTASSYLIVRGKSKEFINEESL